MRDVFSNCSGFTASREFTEMICGLRPFLVAAGYKICHSHSLAEDLAHDTMIKALLNHTGFLGGNIRAWLYTIMYHRYLDMIRHSCREVEESEYGEPSVEFSIDDEIDAERTVASIELLNQTSRDILASLLEYDSYAGVAEALSIKTGTVKSRLCRARDALNPDRPRRRQRPSRPFEHESAVQMAS